MVRQHNLMMDPLILTSDWLIVQSLSSDWSVIVDQGLVTSCLVLVD